MKATGKVWGSTFGVFTPWRPKAALTLPANTQQKNWHDRFEVSITAGSQLRESLTVLPDHLWQSDTWDNLASDAWTAAHLSLWKIHGHFTDTGYAELSGSAVTGSSNLRRGHGLSKRSGFWVIYLLSSLFGSFSSVVTSFSRMHRLTATLHVAHFSYPANESLVKKKTCYCSLETHFTAIYCNV